MLHMETKPRPKQMFLRWEKDAPEGRYGMQHKVRLGRPVFEATASATAAVSSAVGPDARMTMGGRVD